jgi:hypothetical protein
LLATQAAGRIRSILGVELSVRAVFDSPTFASFALALAKMPLTNGTTPQAIARVPRNLYRARVEADGLVLPRTAAAGASTPRRREGIGMNATIEFVESVNEATLLIDGAQAMQGWEADLMRRSGDILCRHGSEFMEVGLGLGLSALHIGSRPTTRRHTVIELHQPVIDHFLARNPTLPAALKITHGDFFAMLPTLPRASVDGIFFDPYLPAETRNDPAFWNAVVPPMMALLRPGGVFVPALQRSHTSYSCISSTTLSSNADTTSPTRKLHTPRRHIRTWVHSVLFHTWLTLSTGCPSKARFDLRGLVCATSGHWHPPFHQLTY